MKSHIFSDDYQTKSSIFCILALVGFELDTMSVFNEQAHFTLYQTLP